MPSMKKPAPEIVPGMAEAIAARMNELNLSPSGLRNKTGLTLSGLAPLRKGHRKRYLDDLKFAVCKAFKWTPDSIDRLMRGEPAVQLEEDGTAVEELTHRVRALEAQLERTAGLSDRVVDLANQVGELTGAVAELRAGRAAGGSVR